MINLSQKQSDAWHYLEDKVTTEICYGGGAGGGKSMLGCLWHIRRRINYRETRGLIGREQLSTLKGSTLITYFKVCKLLGYVNGKDFKLNANEMVINWRNGSVTVFKELFDYPADPDFERLGSTEYTDAFIDEAGEITLKAFEIVNTRIRWMLSDYNLIPKTLITCNPGWNWVRNRFIRDDEGNDIMLKNYQKYIRALVIDNPDKDFTRIYIEQLGKLSNSYDRARLLDGDWDATPKTGGEFYKQFNFEKHTQKCDYDSHLPLHISFDFNVNPYMTATIYQATDKKSWQIDELCLKSPNNSTGSVCKEIIRRYQGHESGMFIYGDPAGKHEDTRSEKGYNDYTIILRELAIFKPQLRISKSAPSVVMRGNFINQVFQNGYDRIEIFFSPNCLTSIADFTNIKESADGTKVKTKVKDPKTGITFEKYGHTSDSFDYFFCTYFQQSFNKYVSGGKLSEIRIGKSVSNNAY